MRTLHLLGFEQWMETKSAGKIENPSETLIAGVIHDPVLIKEVQRALHVDRIRTSILPVPMKGGIKENLKVFRAKLQPVLDSMEARRGDLCLAFGQGAIMQKSAILEDHFINRFQVEDSVAVERVDSNDEADRIIGLDAIATKIAGRARRAGVNIYSGIDKNTNAGTFYCNVLGYKTFQTLPLGHALFVHVPGLSDSVTAGKIWRANTEKYRSAGIDNQADAPFMTPEQNIEIFRGLISAWKPDEI